LGGSHGDVLGPSALRDRLAKDSLGCALCFSLHGAQGWAFLLAVEQAGLAAIELDSTTVVAGGRHSTMEGDTGGVQAPDEGQTLIKHLLEGLLSVGRVKEAQVGPGGGPVLLRARGKKIAVGHRHG